MNTEKMNGGFANLSIMYRRLKRVFVPYEDRIDSLSLILDIKAVIDNLMEFRLTNRDNIFLERQVKEALHMHSKLVECYHKKFGEFPFEIVELAQ